MPNGGCGLSIKKGDFVIMDYTAEVKETGEAFDTTIEEEAKKRGVFRQGVVYEPMLVVVGEGWVLKSLDDALSEVEVEKTTTIEIPPDKGFGPRDASKVRMIPISRFKAQGVNVRPGMQVEVEGKVAVVRAVGAGRVQVDFNPPLAGKTLVYNLTPLKVIEDNVEKIKALIHRRLPSASVDLINLTLTDKSVSIQIPEQAFYVEGLQIAKRAIASDVQKFFPEIEEVTFVETIPLKKPTTPPSAASPEQEVGQENK